MQKNKMTGKTRKIVRIGIDASRAFVKNPAGPEYYSLNLIQTISKVDKINQYILYLRQGQKPNFRLPHNFKVKEVRLPYLWTQVGLAWETITNPPDVLFVPAHTLPLITRILRQQLPIVVTIHGLEGKFLPQSSNYLAHIYRNWSIGWAVRFATLLIAVSSYTKKDVLTTYQIDKNKIKVVHEGVDERYFEPVSQTEKQRVLSKYKIKKEYILFVGTIQPRKNLIRLIKAFSLLKNNKIELILAGKLGWSYRQILRAPKKYAVQARFIGRVRDSDLPALYQGARAFILPSITEGFGLPVLEAQASGTPLVVTEKGAPSEVAGSSAILVNPYSVEDITLGLRKVLENANIKKQVNAGRQNAKKFTWQKAAYKTINALLKVVRK